MESRTTLFVSSCSCLLVSLALVSRATAGVTEVLDSSLAGVTVQTPSGVAVDGSDNVIVNTVLSGAFRVEPDGTITRIIDSAGDGAGNLFGGGYEAAADAEGNAYLTSFSPSNVFRVSPDGTVTLVLDSTGDGTGNTLGAPFGIDVDADGNVFVAGSATNNAFRVTPGGLVTEIVDATGDGAGHPLTTPYGIAVDGSGNVFVAGTESDNVLRVAPGGAITQVIGPDGDGAGNTLDRPFGLDVDAEGNLFVTGDVSNNVFRVAAEDGEVTLVMDASGDGAGNTLTGAPGVVVDGLGHVYVSGSGSDNAFWITPAGGVTEILDASGDGTSFFDVSYGIAIDSMQRVFVAGLYSHNVMRVDGLCNIDCDDGNPCTQDSCEPETGCLNDTVPATGCRVSTIASLSLVDPDNPAKRSLKLQWKKGATAFADFGTPLTTTTWTMCAYDAAGLVARAEIPAAATCVDGAPCWSEKGPVGAPKKLLYLDKGAPPCHDGVTRVVAKADDGTAGKASISLQAKGPNIPAMIMAAPGLATPVIAQVLTSDGPACWEATFTAGQTTKNDGTQFAAKKK